MSSVKLQERLRTFGQIIKEPLPPIVWAVEPLISVGNRVVLYGEFGSLKSWLLLDLALHLAAGRPWLDTFKVPRPRSVLYLDEEQSEHQIRRRVKRLAEGNGLAGEESLPLRIASRAGVRFTDGCIGEMLEQLRLVDFDPEVIIFETFRRILEGSEIDVRDVAAFWRRATHFFPEDKTLIVSHHMKKPGQDGRGELRHQASGSTDILAGPDCAIPITRKGNIVIVESVKHRDAQEPEAFQVQVDFGEGEDSPISLRYVGTRPDGMRDETEVERAVGPSIAFLKSKEDGRARTGEINAHLQQCRFSKRTAERVPDHLTGLGYAEKVRRGIWRLTDKGRML